LIINYFNLFGAKDEPMMKFDELLSAHDFLGSSNLEDKK